MKHLLIILLFFLIAGSCQKRQEEESMKQLIDRVMPVAVEQYKGMAQLLPEGQFPRSISEDGRLKHLINIGGVVDFILELFGICMSIPVMRIFIIWLKSIQKC